MWMSESPVARWLQISSRHVENLLPNQPTRLRNSRMSLMRPGPNVARLTPVSPWPKAVAKLRKRLQIRVLNLISTMMMTMTTIQQNSDPGIAAQLSFGEVSQ